MPKQTFFNLAEEKRNLILQAAVEEFAEKGYKAASISRIVAVSKIAKGSFYQYFDDKDDLFEHIVTTMLAQRKLNVFESARHRLEDLNLTEFLRLVFRRQIEWFQNDPSIIKIGLDLIKLVDEPIYKRLLSTWPERDSYFSSFIQYEIDQGDIDPSINVQMLNFMLLSLGQYLLARYQELGADVMTVEFLDKLSDDMEYILTKGIYGHLKG